MGHRPPLAGGGGGQAAAPERAGSEEQAKAVEELVRPRLVALPHFGLEGTVAILAGLFGVEAGAVPPALAAHAQRMAGGVPLIAKEMAALMLKRRFVQVGRFFRFGFG